MAQNRLSTEVSPYLLQHRDNPVDWYPWCDEAFAQAKMRNLPVFLSIGYSACHWCHVMAHESFEDQATADILNQNYISIKLDREEHPDLDAIYMGFLQSMGVAGGWPVSLFLTSEREPFWGGTYFPPVDRYGSPSFKSVLVSIANAYRGKSEKISLATNRLIAAHNYQKPIDNHEFELSSDHLSKIVQSICSIMDFEYGGIEGAPKFPQFSLLEFLYRYGKLFNHDQCKRIVKITVDRIVCGGIYDHLGGGISRYSTDPYWLVPHFEKMLYDNAQLIGILAQQYQCHSHEIYLEKIAETIDWLDRELFIADNSSTDSKYQESLGAYAAALDADSLNSNNEMEEGAFYIWTDTEVNQILVGDSEPFKNAYGITAEGNWREPHAHNYGLDANPLKSILNQREMLEAGVVFHPGRENYRYSREKLLAARSHRPRPSRDYKIMVDWNGMAIAALVKAAFVMNNPKWLAKALSQFDYLCAVAGGNGAVPNSLPSLKHSFTVGSHGTDGLLEDYSHMIAAALALYQVTGLDKYIALAENWTEFLDSHFYDQGSFGYYMSRSDVTQRIKRIKSITDSATPSGNGTMLENLARLYWITGKSHYQHRAECLFKLIPLAIAKSPIGTCSLLSGYIIMAQPLSLVLVIDAEFEKNHEILNKTQPFEAFFAVLRQKYLPNLVIIYGNLLRQFPIHHPAFGKSAINHMPTAFLCKGFSCSLPITDAAELAKLLDDND